MDTAVAAAKAALERRHRQAEYKLRKYLQNNEAFARTPTSQLSIWGGSRTALHKKNLETVADILRQPASAIYYLDNFGWTSLVKLMKYFQDHEVNFVFWQGYVPRLPDRLMLSNPVQLSEGVRMLAEGSGQLCSSLEQKGYNTIGDLVCRSAAELGKLKGFGPTGFFNLMEVCEHSGLELKPM